MSISAIKMAKYKQIIFEKIKVVIPNQWFDHISLFSIDNELELIEFCLLKLMIFYSEFIW